ncbi:hypothetical protein G6F56_008542 [Rhizopus delemar]|nr:hypothetical protein G6F56_008542 [Rhizopus delemar]
MTFEERSSYYLVRRLGAVTSAYVASLSGPSTYKEDPIDIDTSGEMGDSFQDDPMDVDDPFMEDAFEDDPMDVGPPSYAVSCRLIRECRSARTSSRCRRPKSRRI